MMKRNLRLCQLTLIMGGEGHFGPETGLILTNFPFGTCSLESHDILEIGKYDWSHLKRLNLFFNQIGQRGVKYLLRIQMPQLKSLQLGSCCIGNQGLKNLSKGRWNKLEQLNISSNYLSIEAYETLKYGDWRLNQLRVYEASPINYYLIIATRFQVTNFNQQISNAEMRNQIQLVFKSRFDVKEQQIMQETRKTIFFSS